MCYEGRALGPDDVRNADVLLVRSVTEVGPALLDGSSVQFVGSATIGTDHVDQAYLAEHERKEILRFLTCGSVDDGKSTSSVACCTTPA